MQGHSSEADPRFTFHGLGSEVRTPLADFFSILLGLLRSFVMINVPNQDCAASVIHERFDPIPDMGRSIDSSIFVMRHATFDTTDFLKHIGPALNRRHLSF
jgi:hypothetical protein